jgi:two-component system OmpR family sensor kinase
VDPDHLPARIDVDVPSEMAVIRERLDDLLIRLAKAMEREKGTIADIAHELRTPVAGLRSTLEFATFGADAGRRKLAERCLPTVVTMQAMITNLLTLARLESGQEQVACQATDLGEVVADCWRSLEPVAQKRHTVMRITLPDELPEADTCPTKARMVMSNLFDNAIAHAPEGSTITVELMADDTWVRLIITNPCTGPLPDGDTLFRPFWRGDAARTGGGLHCGLGLALCRRLMTLLRGDITADTTTTGVFRIQLAFPRLTAT